MSGLRAIGRGGSAAAHLGLFGGREVVVKLFHAPGDPRAAREAEILVALGAPLVPALLDRGELADGRPYLVLERLASPSLEEERGAPVAPARAAALIAAAARAVDRMHAAGVVHRDLKPAHVFVRGEEATLIDFALARPPGRPGGAAPPALTRPGERAGTAHYMAPEQCRGAGDIGPAADLYALGVIAFELLAGRRPFAGSAGEVRAAHVAARPPALSSLVDVPPAVDDVVARALAKDPARRYPRGADLAE